MSSSSKMQVLASLMSSIISYQIITCQTACPSRPISCNQEVQEGDTNLGNLLLRLHNLSKSYIPTLDV